MSKNLPDIVRKAQKLFLAQKYDEALKHYNRAIELDPRDAKLWIKKGDTLRKLGQNEKAVRVYSRAAAKYALTGFLPQAVSVNKLILEIDPGHVETQQALADLYAKQGIKPRQEPAKPEPIKRKLPAPIQYGEEVENAMGQRTLVVVRSKLAEIKTLSDDEKEALGLLNPFAEAAKPVVDQDELILDEVLEQEVTRFAQASAQKTQQASLPQLPLFSSLTRAEFAELIANVATGSYEAGDLIVRQGDQGRTLFVITEGLAAVERNDLSGQAAALAQLKSGDYFGEYGFLTGRARSASVRALEATTVLAFDYAKYAKLLRGYPEVAEQLRNVNYERMLQAMFTASPLFQAVPASDRRAALALFERRGIADGKTVLAQNVKGGGLFVILSGDVDMQIKSRDGTLRSVARLREGDLFGEIAALTDKATPASFVAVGAAIVFRLAAEAVAGLIERYPKLATVLRAEARKKLKLLQAGRD